MQRENAIDNLHIQVPGSAKERSDFCMTCEDYVHLYLFGVGARKRKRGATSGVQMKQKNFTGHHTGCSSKSGLGQCLSLSLISLGQAV